MNQSKAQLEILIPVHPYYLLYDYLVVVGKSW